MTYADQVRNTYFDWMVDIVSHGRFHKSISYRKLFTLLHNTEFRYSVKNDDNRYEDGMDLRYRFAYSNQDLQNAEFYLRGPCSVLEMIVALALRCEEGIMDDPAMGNRTAQWFWGMVVNLGLGGMTDEIFDREYAEQIVTRFLDREYEPNGKGGLFYVRNTTRDLRDVEIWYQMCWYLDNIV